ncbi:MAG: hypothetical protein AAFQ63_10780 [Cyanobacteria bacterium J06621_11]
MAIVLALVIVGWLVAFALGNQAGFNNASEAPKASENTTTAETATAYREPASAS